MRKYLTKRNTAVVLMICLIALCFAIPDMGESTAAATLTASAKVNATAGAYLREGPSTSTKKVTLLKNNTSITITEEVFTSTKSTKASTRWYAVTVSGKSGYIRADLVDTIKYSSSSRKTTDALNYRVGPSTKMTRKGTYKKGASVTVVLQSKLKGSDAVWYKVKKGSKYYYVDSRYVSGATTTTNTTATNAAAANTTTTTTTTTVPETATGTDEDATVIKDDSGNDTGFTISGVTYPISIGEGLPFTLKGVISGEATIDTVTAGAMDKSGNWKISASASPAANTFSIATIDTKIKFGTLTQGSYVYKIVFTSGGNTYTAASYDFKVVKLHGAEALANTAIGLAYPLGTPASKYTYGVGTATDAYKAAMDKVFPKHNTWGKATGSGASCDVFISTVCRYCGYDTSMPTGLAGQWKYLPKSSKWQQIDYHFRESELRSGDIITYKRSNGQGHICMYVKINGRGYLAEAAYKSKYGYINTSIRKVISPASNVIWVHVYRPVS